MRTGGLGRRSGRHQRRFHPRAQFTGAPASRADELVAQIATAVEVLSEVTQWRDEPVVSPTLEATRTEPEFVAHIARTVDLDPTGEWTFIVDNLNTHASESLVIWVAEQCDVSDPLGKKTCAASWNR